MFEGIIGNEKIKQELIKSIDSNKYSQSYLFLGIPGIGKKMIAMEFAKMLLCNSEKKYCNNCKSCIEFNSNNNPDFTIIEPDGNSVKINQIREIQSKIYEPPIISDKKVYIINDADKMTTEAQNALLKTLEEPPKFIIIILIGSDESNFLSTIKSRCLIYKFSHIKYEQIKNLLSEKYEINEVIEEIIKAAEGSVSKAIELIDNIDIYKSINDLFSNITNNLIDFLKQASFLYKLQENQNEILDYINVLLFNQIQNNKKYLDCISIVEDTKQRLKVNSNYNMTIDNMLIKIWEVIH